MNAANARHFSDVTGGHGTGGSGGGGGVARCGAQRRLSRAVPYRAKAKPCREQCVQSMASERLGINGRRGKEGRSGR